MNTLTPPCPRCHRPLDRIDHYAIEHLVLRSSMDGKSGDVFIPATLDDDDEITLASEVDLRCGRCGVSLPQEARAFFYRRWYQVLALQDNDV